MKDYFKNILWNEFLCRIETNLWYGFRDIEWLYFSSLFRRTTSAVVANLATALFLWAVLPLLLTIASDISHNYTPMKMCIKANPMVQTAITIRGDSGDNNARAYPGSLVYRWPSDQAREFGYTTIVLLYSSAFYISTGLYFGWRAKRRLRKNIF